MAKAKDFKFCTMFAPMKYYSWDDKLSLKWAWLQSRDQFKFRVPIISRTTEVVKFCTHVGRIKLVVLR